MLQERMSLLKNHFCHDIKYYEAFSKWKNINKNKKNYERYMFSTTKSIKCFPLQFKNPSIWVLRNQVLYVIFTKTSKVINLETIHNKFRDFLMSCSS